MMQRAILCLIAFLSITFQKPQTITLASFTTHQGEGHKEIGHVMVISQLKIYLKHFLLGKSNL